MTLEVILSILAGSVAAGLVMSFCLTPVLGVLQQCGYSERGLFRWYFHKHNMLRRRHALLALSELLLVSLFALCFSFLGSALACLVSAAPFVGLGVLYILSSRHALKVPLRRSARMMRLGGCCFVLVCVLIFGVSCGMWFAAEAVESELFRLFRFVPIALLPLLFPFLAALAGLLIRCIGTLPNLVLMSMVADAMDHVEWKSGIRCDSFMASVYTVISTLVSGFAVSIFNIGITAFDYQPPIDIPEGSGLTQVVQNASMQNYFVFICFILPAILFVLVAILMVFYNLDKKLPGMQKEIAERHKAEAEAKGLVYVDPIEAERLEQEEFDRIAEENRVKELKAKCEKKGLDFDTENNKYLAARAERERKWEAKQAAKKAKQEARAAKRKKDE